MIATTKGQKTRDITEGIKIFFFFLAILSENIKNIVNELIQK